MFFQVHRLAMPYTASHGRKMVNGEKDAEGRCQSLLRHLQHLTVGTEVNHQDRNQDSLSQSHNSNQEPLPPHMRNGSPQLTTTFGRNI